MQQQSEKSLQDLPVSGFGNDGQAGEAAEEARGGAVQQANQQEHKHGTVQAHHHVQTHAVSGVEAPLQQVREDEQHIQNDGLHSVESHVPAEIGVPHHHEIQSQEHQEPIEGEALEHSNRRNQRLDERLEGGELRDDVLPVLHAVEERVEVGDGRY